MTDSITLILRFADKPSDQHYQDCNLPFEISRKVNEDGEIRSEYFDQVSVVSPLTGAKYKVKALGAGGQVQGYEIQLNVPACLIGRNHVLVNGVYYAAEGALELLKHYALERGCSALGLEQFQLGNTRLESVTGTFLFEFDRPEEAQERLQELRNYAYGVLNYTHKQRGKATQPAFVVGGEHCFTLYIKQREFTVRAYIKQPNVDKAFATFPSPEVEQELVSLGQRTLRVEVVAHGKWLRDQRLDKPEAWRGNPGAYQKLFDLARSTLRLDEELHVRKPTEAVIDKLPAKCQSLLKSHLSGRDVRQHPHVLGLPEFDQSNPASSKRFSAFRAQILNGTGVDISIPWEKQSGLLSPGLPKWFVYPGEFVPPDGLQEHVFSRVSVPAALGQLRELLVGNGFDSGGQPVLVS